MRISVSPQTITGNKHVTMQTPDDCMSLANRCSRAHRTDTQMVPDGLDTPVVRVWGDKLDMQVLRKAGLSQVADT